MAQKTTKPTLTSATLRPSATKKVIAPQATEAVVPKVETEVKSLRRKEFVERVAARSGLKLGVIKSTLEAILGELGDALSAGEVVTLQPLGKIMVNRQKNIENGEVLICKLRRKRPVAPE